MEGNGRNVKCKRSWDGTGEGKAHFLCILFHHHLQACSYLCLFALCNERCECSGRTRQQQLYDLSDHPLVGPRPLPRVFVAVSIYFFGKNCSRTLMESCACATSVFAVWSCHVRKWVTNVLFNLTSPCMQMQPRHIWLYSSYAVDPIAYPRIFTTCSPN